MSTPVWVNWTVADPSEADCGRRIAKFISMKCDHVFFYESENKPDEHYVNRWITIAFKQVDLDDVGGEYRAADCINMNITAAENLSVRSMIEYYDRQGWRVHHSARFDLVPLSKP